jgi:hypothetical protein
MFRTANVTQGSEFGTQQEMRGARIGLLGNGLQEQLGGDCAVSLGAGLESLV